MSNALPPVDEEDVFADSDDDGDVIMADAFQQNIHWASDDDDTDDERLDNPAPLPAPNRTTIGFELEFLTAPCSKTAVDPHPTDGRLNWEAVRNRLDDPGDIPLNVIAYGLRNNLIDTLRNEGIAANKTLETPHFGRYSCLPTDRAIVDHAHHWWDSFPNTFEEQLRGNPAMNNDEIIRTWRRTYKVERRDRKEFREATGSHTLVQSFKDFHINKGIQPHFTTFQSVASLGIRNRIVGHASNPNKDAIAARFHDEIHAWLVQKKHDYHVNEQRRIDPNCVRVRGSNTKYHAWTCIEECTVEAPWVCPVDAIGNRVAPQDLYVWWSAEVISPIYDVNNVECRKSVFKVCQTLRDTFRIHKPLEEIGNGLHVHVGQELGWTLLHLKKFATLYVFLERELFSYHRRDRSTGMYCTPMKRLPGGLLEWAFRDNPALFGNDNRATTQEPDKSRYERQLENHVPLDQLNKLGGDEHKMRLCLQNLWQYDTVDQVAHRFGADAAGVKGALKVYIRGRKRSQTFDGASKDTIEFRMMQGTLDAGHIWKWARICTSLVSVARDSNRTQFKNLIGQLLNEERVLENAMTPEDRLWWSMNKTDGQFFEYPDLFWPTVFMAPGAGDVNG
ncbi:hypothetical protein F5Y16DRAFT_415929 [Xylariaceae sp. FL0255]|nr:hypothetical protein F5Y16DRAFT_415929 [Xylariaceae sp. FL0255]